MSDTIAAPQLDGFDDDIVVETQPARDEACETAAVPPSVRASVLRVVQHGLTLFVVLCVGLVAFLFAGTAVMHSRYQRALRDEFRSNDQNGTLPPTTTTDSTGALNVVPIHTGTAVALLRIPRLGVEEVVSEGTKSSITLRGPGHLAATPLPGQLGNAVIIGRHSTGGAPFADLGSLKPGDRFSFVVAGGVVDYRVSAVGTHRASDLSIFATQRSGRHSRNTATLVTTASMLDTDHRLVVVGELQGTPHGFTPGRIAPNPEDLGLGADHSALVPLAFALQLLLIASLGSVWLAKRWHRYAAWTVATPMLLACAWFAFEQFARLLPAAL